MTGSRRKAFAVLFAMVLAAALAQAGKPTLHLADRIGKPDLERLFPSSFADWRIDTSLPVVLPAPDVQAKLDAIYNQVLTRTYINDRGERVMLSVAYGGDQSDGTRAHRPEVCYPAQGFQIVYNAADQIDIGGRPMPVRRLMSRLATRHEPITYWMVVGGKVITSSTQQKLVELRYGLRGVIPDGMLIRVSSIDTDMKRGHALQTAFVRSMAGAMSGEDRARVFGAMQDAL
jgi:EpsI family protein